MSVPDPDLPLWQELQRGHEAALDTLMERHGGSLFRFIYRHVLNEEDARDLLQETFVRAYFKRHQFQPRARISTWLYRIALNLCRDHARSRATKQDHRTDSLTVKTTENADQQRDFPSSAADPAQATETKEELAVLHQAIHDLPHDLKTAFILAVLEDRPQKECAELLGITPKAVETRVYRARKILEAKLTTSRE